MKKYTITALMKHEVVASPQEVIENYTDYGHEVYAHGKYSPSNKKHVSRINKVSYKVISTDEREVVAPLSFLGGLIKTSSAQRVNLIRWSGIVSEGTMCGFPARSRWFIWPDNDGKTICWVVYEFDVPWPLFFLEPLVKVAIRHLRERIWDEDRVMLERRDALLKRGFGDWGKRFNTDV